jgi:hypothetical protein
MITSADFISIMPNEELSRASETHSDKIVSSSVIDEGSFVVILHRSEVNKMISAADKNHELPQEHKIELHGFIQPAQLKHYIGYKVQMFRSEKTARAFAHT